ncbi:hypothetical protein ACSBR1_037909 [Camellia fascicularis]
MASLIRYNHEHVWGGRSFGIGLESKWGWEIGLASGKNGGVVRNVQNWVVDQLVDLLGLLYSVTELGGGSITELGGGSIGGPSGASVASEFDFKGLIFFIKSWRKCAFGQIASSFGFSHSNKCLIGGVLFLEIPFLFLFSTALSGHALLIQHPVVILGETIFWGLKSTNKPRILST